MLEVSIYDFPQEFELQVSERYGWIHGVHLIINNNYCNSIPMEWVGFCIKEQASRYSIFKAVCDDPNSFNITANSCNSYSFQYLINGQLYNTETTQFFVNTKRGFD